MGQFPHARGYRSAHCSRDGRNTHFLHRRTLMYTSAIHWIVGWTRAVTLLGLAYLAA